MAAKKTAPPVPEPAATPAPPAQEGHCIRCGAPKADFHHNARGPFCGSGCAELSARGL